MGNAITKRKRRSSQAIRPMFSSKLDYQIRADDKDEFDSTKDLSDSNSSNGYVSDNLESNQSCAGKSGNPTSKSQSARLFSFQTVDLKSGYCMGMELRRGRSGVVRVCIDRKTGERLACKTLEKKFINNKIAAERVKREFEIMSRIAGHPNVIELKGICEDAHNVHLIMELASGGDLSDCIISRNQPFPEALAAMMFKQIALGVKFIHSKGIVHRDIKPENILVVKSNSKQKNELFEGKHFNLKLGDFGMAVKLNNGKRLKGIRGTKVFLAPEMLNKDTDYSFEVDIWSLGVLLYVLLLKEVPFNGNTDQELFSRIKAGKLSFKSHCSWTISDSAKDLIERMLTVDPKSRWTIDRVLESPWLKKFCTK